MKFRLFSCAKSSTVISRQFCRIKIILPTLQNQTRFSIGQVHMYVKTAERIFFFQPLNTKRWTVGYNKFYFF